MFDIPGAGFLQMDVKLGTIFDNLIPEGEQQKQDDP